MDKAERGRRDAGDAAGLSKSDGTHALQRLKHLPRKPADGAVIDPLRNGDRLGSLELLYRFSLLVKITGEFDPGFDGASLVAQDTWEGCGVAGVRAPIPADCRGQFDEHGLLREGFVESGKHWLDGDLRPLEQLRPGEAGSGCERSESSGLDTLRVRFAGG